MGSALNKIASIFVQAAADAAFEKVQISESEKIDKAIKAVKGALDKAHAGALAHLKTKRLYRVLSNYCREDAILLISEFAKKYETFINATTFITGRWVEYMENPYADKSDDHIRNDIKFSILIVYFAAVTEEGTKTVVTKALKGIFDISEKEIKEVLLANQYK